MPENKTVPTSTNVETFLNEINPPVRKQDALVLLELMREITGEDPKIWGPSIVGFGSYHYKYESGREGDMPVLAFSPRKQHMVLYVLNNFKGQADLLEQLGKHKTGKFCLYVKKLLDIDLVILKKIMVESSNKTHSKYNL